MPYKSDAQRRFFHTDTAKKAGITSSDVEEFDKASKGKKLPEKVQHKAEGGEVFNPPQGNWEAIKASLMQGKTQEGEPGLQDATVPDFVAPMIGAKTAELAMPEMEAALKGLGEAGEVTLGKAPEMEGMAPKIEVFSKGVQKGGAEPVTIWGVKGDPNEIAKLGYGPNPGSIPEHILKQHGLLPESSISVPSQAAPNAYAHGGEVKVHDKKTGLSASAQPIQVAGMAYGGETNPKKETISAMENNPTAGFADGGTVTNAALNLLGASGIPGLGDIGMIRDMSQAAPAVNQTMSPTPPPPNPNIDQDFINKLNAGTTGIGPAPQQPPSLSQAAQIAQQGPATDYNLFKGISAEDRANLYKQLLAQRSSPGMMAAKGVAGLGDAITSAFGKQPTNALGNIRETANQNVQQQISAVDTERQQKLQDIQGSIALQEADPKSPYSEGMRTFLQNQGIKVPSGMSAAMMKQTLPDVAKVFDAHTQAVTQRGAQAVEAGKALYGQTWGEWLRDKLGVGGTETGQTALERAAGTTPSTGGWSVVR